MTGARVPEIVVARLIELGFAEGTYRVWDGVGELTAGGRTWTGLGRTLGVSEVDQRDALQAQPLTLSLTRAHDDHAMDRDAFLAAVNAERTRDVFRRPVTVLRQHFARAPSGLSAVGDPVVEFAGRMSHVGTSRTGEGEVGITLTCDPLLVRHRRPSRRLLTNADQTRAYPSDRGLELVAQVAETVLVWPRD